MRRTKPRGDVTGPGGPAAYGRPQGPIVPVPIPVLASAALVAAIALGWASGKARPFGGVTYHAASRGFGGPSRRGAAGCGSRREEERPAHGEETVVA